MKENILQVAEAMKNNKQLTWFLCWIAKWVLLILAFFLYTIVVARAAGVKAERKYEAWQERYVSDFLAQEEAKREGMPVDPYEAQLDAEAQNLARVLYGVKNNSSDDLKTYCWCVFNRVDSPDYPGTLDEVIEQPKQWMRYSPDSPVLEDLYQIAREQLDNWHTGTTRPCSAEFVFMNWTQSKIVLRDRWEEGSQTSYWRWGQ